MSFQKQEHLEWEEGSTGRQGGEQRTFILSLLRKLCFWKVSLTQKSPSTHLLHTLRAISSLAAPLQGEDNVQLLLASSNDLEELWGLHRRVQQGRVQHGRVQQGTQKTHSGHVQVALLSLVPAQG